ncbi:hypothetical protein L4C33_06140 [Vibrio makurazakiensis]|uniref:hypothetical protein n=1 Tax=Vibrio makurazakiensis TaxID=2910250 RepID=UPI003D0F80BB
MSRKKVLLLASPGGHFVQLSLLAECLQEHQTVVVGTYSEMPKFITAKKYYSITDFSRDDFYKAFQVAWQCYKVLRKEMPDLVVTTGAAPGLVMIFVSKLFRKKVVWIDSIANSRKLSMSGAIAQKIGANVISQWKDVSQSSGNKYYGRLI